MGAGLSLPLSSSPPTNHPSWRTRLLAANQHFQLPPSVPPESPWSKRGFCRQRVFPLLAKSSRGREGLFDFCCARESFCPRDIVLIWLDEKTAGGGRFRLEIEGNRSWEGDSEERKPISVIPFSSPPFGLTPDERGWRR